MRDSRVSYVLSSWFAQCSDSQLGKDKIFLHDAALYFFKCQLKGETFNNRGTGFFTNKYELSNLSNIFCPEMESALHGVAFRVFSKTLAVLPIWRNMLVRRKRVPFPCKSHSFNTFPLKRIRKINLTKRMYRNCLVRSQEHFFI